MFLGGSEGAKKIFSQGGYWQHLGFTISSYFIPCHYQLYHSQYSLKNLCTQAKTNKTTIMYKVSEHCFHREQSVCTSTHRGLKYQFGMSSYLLTFTTTCLS
jgi:hypothetical protein